MLPTTQGRAFFEQSIVLSKCNPISTLRYRLSITIIPTDLIAVFSKLRLDLAIDFGILLGLIPLLLDLLLTFVICCPFDLSSLLQSVTH